METIQVGITSDNRLFSEGVKRILSSEPSFAVAWIAATPAQQPRPDVILLDSQMPHALEAAANLPGNGAAAEASRPRVILVAGDEDGQLVVRALEAGMSGVLTRDAGPEQLIKAIRVVHEGQIWAPRQAIVAGLLRLAAAATAESHVLLQDDRLSEREKVVLHHAASGLSNKEIADRLSISGATVKAHLSSIFQKVGCRSRTELAAAYHGLRRGAAHERPRTHS